MSTPLASFFTKIGFEVDKSSLNSLDKQLGLLEKRIASMAKSFQGVTNNPAVRAAASLARAEATRINNESKLVTQKIRLAQVEGKVAVATAKVQETANRLGIKKETTAGYYAKVNASEMMGRMKVGAAADMAAIKESFASGQKLRQKQVADEKLGRDLIMMRKRNEVDESKNRRRLIQDQSQNNRVQLKGILDVQRIQAQTAKFAQQAVTKATPYAQRTRMGNSGSRSSVGMDSGGGFGRLSIPTSLGTVAGGLAAQRVAQKAYHTANFQMAQPVQYEFITGSAEAGAKQVAFLNKEVDRLGLSLLDASQQYKQLLATSYKPLGEAQTQKLFTGAQNLASMLGLTTDAQNRMFRAFGQMSSKGQVMAEELNFRLAA